MERLRLGKKAVSLGRVKPTGVSGKSNPLKINGRVESLTHLKQMGSLKNRKNLRGGQPAIPTEA